MLSRFTKPLGHLIFRVVFLSLLSPKKPFVRVEKLKNESQKSTILTMY